LSFQIKKRLPIGRGGAILTNDADAAAWLRLARYDGRDLDTAYNSDDHVKQIGWHMYMTPEDAARGILLFDQLSDDFSDVADNNSYPDISNWLSEITK
jgi:dTDP-4-amino-4,6-dideoxygalactose transaminase